jgi:hypothetical protein
VVCGKKHNSRYNSKFAAAIMSPKDDNAAIGYAPD